MSLYEKLKEAVALNSDSRSTLEMYWHWAKAFHRFNAAGIMKRVTPHTLRHAYVTHSLQNGNDIATVQQLVGHEDVATTMIYAHGDSARGVSPMDGLAHTTFPTVNFLN